MQMVRTRQPPVSRFQNTLRRIIAPWVITNRFFGDTTVGTKAIDGDLFGLSTMTEMFAFTTDSSDFVALLQETSNILKVITKASGVTLYKVDSRNSEIYLYTQKLDEKERYRVRWKIKNGTTVATVVAHTKDYVLVPDVMSDKRFPEGVDYEGGEQVKSVLAVPILSLNGDCYAVVELYRTVFDESFSLEELKIVVMVTGWMGAAIHQDWERETLQRQQELNDYLLDLLKRYFQQNRSNTKTILEIIKLAKSTLGAERGSMFTLDKERNELVGELMVDDETLDITENAPITKTRIKKDAGIAGVVLKTGQPLNVQDAYRDDRFSKEVDEKTGFITRSILCHPILSADQVIGVVQVINKKTGGNFTTADEVLFHTFTSYITIVHHYEALVKLRRQQEIINKWYLLMFNFHGKGCTHDKQYMRQRFKHITIPQDFHDISWYIEPESRHKMPIYTVYILNNMIGAENIDLAQTMNFVLAVQKFHNNNLYHNFEHAFHVCHTTYLILLENMEMFTAFEIKALLLAALCHDLDHFGRTSLNLVQEKDDLAFLYNLQPNKSHSTYIMYLLMEHFNIFPMMEEDERNELLDEIRDNILGMSIGSFYKYDLKIRSLMEHKYYPFSWDNKAHRRYVKWIILLSADLSDQYKNYPVARNISMKRFREAHPFETEEKVNSQLCPLNELYAERLNKLPKYQLKYVIMFVIPCADLLRLLLPNTEYIFMKALVVCKDWGKVINDYGRRMWRPHDSFVHKQ